MVDFGKAATGQFCWLDLAAADAESAKAFYGRLFGWTARDQAANGGTFTRLRVSGHDIGSMYQLSRAHRDHGVPSHWTPYVRVDDADAAARQASALGGEVIVPPFDVPGTARIALVIDPVGAQVGLWQPIEEVSGEEADG